MAGNILTSFHMLVLKNFCSLPKIHFVLTFYAKFSHIEYTEKRISCKLFRTIYNIYIYIYIYPNFKSNFWLLLIDDELHGLIQERYNMKIVKEDGKRKGQVSRNLIVVGKINTADKTTYTISSIANPTYITLKYG